MRGAPRRAAALPGRAQCGPARYGKEEENDLSFASDAVAGRDHEVGEQGELGVDDVVGQLRGRSARASPSDVPDAKPALLPSVSVSSSGRSTDAIADTSPAVYAVAPLAVSTLPMALSTVGDVVRRGAGGPSTGAGS